MRNPVPFSCSRDRGLPVFSVIPAVMNEELIAVVLGITMLGSWWIGIKLGRSLRAANRSAPQFDGASMALLGLLLAFAFGT